ncbi:MAG: T9SS type A sorting domain-containing protein [Fluviicola sp.]|nr:T9SS type A sorting domain-containing protein [Fluviicola sp.]
MKKIITYLCFSFGAWSQINAQNFELVKDLYSSTDNLLYDYDAGMTYFQGKLYFTSYYGDIVVSDGTDVGTTIISDLGMRKMTALDFQKNKFVPMGGKLYYANRRNELCVTDGTSSGTSMLIDIHLTDSTENYGVKELLGASSTKLFFIGDNGMTGAELWVSDGTTGGTQLINDIVPGAQGFFPFISGTHYVGTVIDEKLYFFAKDATHGWEPWVSDGTVAGTFMLIDSNPNGDCSFGMATSFGGWGASEMKFFALNGLVYFVGFNGIYQTDGTTSGTTLALSGPGIGQFTTSMCVFDNQLYFDQPIAGKRMLVKSDGTLAGTMALDTLKGSTSRFFQEFNGELYMRCKPDGNSSSDQDYIAKLQNDGTIVAVSSGLAGFGHYSVNLVQPVANDFLYMGDYYNHAIYKHDQLTGVNTMVNGEFTSVEWNMLSTPIGTFAIGVNASVGYELWKYNPNGTVGYTDLTHTSSEIRVFPNPATDFLTLDEVPTGACIQISDLWGRVIQSFSPQETTCTIDTHMFPRGVYNIAIITETGMISKKVVIQ